MEAIHQAPAPPDVTAPFILGPDVVLLAAHELDSETRELIECDDDDYVVSRSGARSASRVIDARAAEFLERFREPRTIVEAAILFGRRHGEEPEEVLDGAYPLLRRALGDRVLVSAEAADAQDPLAPSFESGDRVLGCEVRRLIYLLEDTELYRVRSANGFAVLKIRRPGGVELVGTLEHEAAILRLLDGTVAPRVLDAGIHEERPYLLLEHCPGIDPLRVAGSADGSRHQRLELAATIGAAYAELHRHGVLHGDIHPGNVLVDRDGGVRLVDFGLACRFGDARAASKVFGGGVPFYYSPELAESLRDPAARPLATTAVSEQYSLAALLYQVLAGERHLHFSLVREEMLRQIAEEPPLAFAEQELEPWPEVEEVLARSLAREPAARYGSVADLAGRLQWLAAAESAPPTPSPPAPQPALRRLRDRVLVRADLGGEWLGGELPAPDASVTFGAAGVAYALLRIASLYDDPRLAALADVWAERAGRRIGEDPGFYNSEIEIDRHTVGEASPYHTASGVFATRALVAAARADRLTWRKAIGGFLAATDARPVGLDLTLGRSATLIAASLLVEKLPAGEEEGAERLRTLGRETLGRVWSELDVMPAIPAAPIQYLGIAHGWAGFAYAALRWAEATGDSLPDGLPRRLRELAALAEPEGRGAVWPVAPPGSGRPFTSMPGWCNGGAGHVLLWTHAHRLTRDPEHLELAIRAGWETWDDPGSYASLCCGLAGRAWALLALYRSTGDSGWLERAHELGRRGALSLQLERDYPHSLYKGELGLALLAVELERPERSALPFFEAWDD